MIAAPLTDLTRKNSSNKVMWTDNCDKSFKELKRLLCSVPVLRSPDLNVNLSSIPIRQIEELELF